MSGSRAEGRRVAAVALSVLVASSAATPARAGRRALCATASGEAAGPRIAVLSAFPAELAPLVAAADVETTVEAEGRQYYLGRLEGVRVVLGLTGIGLLNAAQRTATVIQTFRPAAILMSAVAGTPHRIGDVVVAAEWVEAGRRHVVHVNGAMLEVARRAATALPAPFQTCTPVPPTSPDGEVVCLPFEPEVVFGRRGQSSDPFGAEPFPCAPGGGEIFGCELPEPAAAAAVRRAARSAAGTAAPVEVEIEVEDMETAAVARIAARHRVPFVAMRAASDGAGDPLGDRGFPAQFFDYYRLAAANAALVTRAWLAELDGLAGDPSARRTCRLLAHRHWRRAARRLRAESSDASRDPPADP
jgi:nucleoside phosphorylase